MRQYTHTGRVESGEGGEGGEWGGWRVGRVESGEGGEWGSCNYDNGFHKSSFLQ